jgi:hypothetical protein
MERTGWSLAQHVSVSDHPVCGAKVGFADFYLMPQPPLLSRRGIQKRSLTMPSTLESFAAMTQDPALALQSVVRMENLRLNIADTLGMMRQGAVLAEGKAALAVGSRLVGWCACARLTEADDIHLTSCTTPGSVIVPNASSSGKRKSLLMRFLLGDARNPMHWDDVLAKSPSDRTVLACLRTTKSIEPIPALIMRYDARCKEFKIIE